MPFISIALKVTAFVLSVTFASIVFAQLAQHEQHASHQEAVESSEQLSHGIIKKIDAEQRTLTIKHGPLANLGMPPMTMVFKAATELIIDHVQPGDGIEFLAESIDGKFVVTKLISTTADH
jgi:Cu(I)/Ag(I) efflux system periplasmic protein CusF